MSVRDKLKPIGNFLFNIVYSIDQFANVVILGGDPDETISSHMGKVKQAHGGVIPWAGGPKYMPWAYPFMKIADKVCNVFDKNHSIKSIEHDEGSKAVVDKDLYRRFDK